MYFYYINYSGNRYLSFVSYFKSIYLGFGGRPAWFNQTKGVGWPEMNFGHLWFVENLLVYCIIYIIIRKLFFKQGLKTGNKKFKFSHIVIVGTIIAAISAVVRIWYPIDKWIALFGFMQSEIAHLPQYVILFIIGIMAYRKSWFDNISKRTGYLSLGLGTLMIFILYAFRSLENAIYFYWAVYEAFLCVLLCFGLVVFFREKINFRTNFLAKNSYAAYIVHFPIVLAVQYSLDKVSIFGALGKFLIVSLLSIIITYLIACIIRKILRAIFFKRY